VFRRRCWVVLLLVSAAPASVMAWGDPTEPPFRSAVNNAVIIKSEAVAPGLTLSSILISPNRRVAVINGEILKPNESIQGARIVAIEPDRVLLDNAGKKIELFLLSDVKQKAGGMTKL